MRVILFVTHDTITENGNLILQELTNYGKVIALVDKTQKTKIKDVEYKKYKNEGYDFGKIYQFLMSYKGEIDELVYTNDTISIIDSFKPLFDWRDRSYLDMGGATSAYSEDTPSSYGHHLQSFFHFFRGKAIEDLKRKYTEKKIIKDKWEGVRIYEVLLTDYIEKRGNKVGAYIEVDYMMKKHGLYRYDREQWGYMKNKVHKADGDLCGTFDNPTLYLKEGLPFVKNSCMQYNVYDDTLLPYLADRCLQKN